MAVGPHVMCGDITALLRTGQSSEGLHSATLASVMEHIRLLESEIVARFEQLQLQATSLNAYRLLHERDLAVQDLKNHKSIFAPIRRLPNDVLLHIFQMSIAARVIPDVRATPWVLGYICHHWRAVSRSSRSLWTNISVMNTRSSYISSGQRNLCKYLLSLSGDSPLNICTEILRSQFTVLLHRLLSSHGDRDIVWEDLAVHSHRWSHMSLSIKGPVSAFENFSCNLPLLRSLTLLTPDLTNPHIGRLFSSAPLLQDLTFTGTIVLWRELARAMPLSQLVRLAVGVTMHKLDDASPDFYACVKKATMLEDLEFLVTHKEDDSEDSVVQPSVQSNAQILPTFGHNSIKRLVLDSKSLSILDQCSVPNLKALSIYSGYGNHPGGSEVESTDPGVEYLLRFVERSDCNVQTFVSFLSTPLSIFKSLWKQWSSSLTNLTVTVTSAARLDAVRELTFKEGKPGILPYLQHLTLRSSEGVSIFQDGSLLGMASSRLTRCPGSFRTLAIETMMSGEDILSQDIITQMKRLREMRAVGVRVELLLVKSLHYAHYYPTLDYFETDERFTKFLKERVVAL